MNRLRWAFAVLGLAFGLAALPFEAAQADEASMTTTATAGLPPGFEPIKGKADVDKVAAAPLVVMAYGAILAALFIYVVMMARTQARIANEMEELRKELERKS